MNWVINKMLEDLEAEMNRRDAQYFIFGMPETQISKELLLKGVVMVKPVATDIYAVATGVIDEMSHDIEIILAKSMQTEVYQNASRETGESYLVRVMDGRDENNALQTNTIRYIIRNHMQDYGMRQPDVTITYNDDRLESVAEGIVTATMNVTIEDHYTQQI